MEKVHLVGWIIVPSSLLPIPNWLCYRIIPPMHFAIHFVDTGKQSIFPTLLMLFLAKWLALTSVMLADVI